MPARTLSATIALATLAAVQACEVCHLHYYHKEVASATAMTSNSYCREYQSQACCSAETAQGVGDAQQGYLYPDLNPANGCGQLTSECEKFFIEEGCFYECDHNLGKWRRHEDCLCETDEQCALTNYSVNGWQIVGAPIKASYCDAWYDACRGEENRLCIGSGSSEGMPEYGYFDHSTCHEEQGLAGCRRIDSVYTSGRHMCETLWAGSFRYENDTTAEAYVMSFEEGQTNPNNLMFRDREYPPMCPGETGYVNMTVAEAQGCDEEVVRSTHSFLGTAPANSATKFAGALGAAAAITAAAVLLA